MAADIQSDSIILFQGNSITDAGRNRMTRNASVGDGLGFGYVRMVADRLHSEFSNNLNIVNKGISGDRIKDLAYRWEKDTLQLQPDLISILIGVNDTWNYLYSGMGSSLDEYLRIYRQLLNTTLSEHPNVQLVLCAPFILITGEVTKEWMKDLAHRQSIVQDLAGEFGAIHVPFQSALDKAVKTSPPHHLLEDGVHPTEKGHRILADCWIKNVLH
jgi:lysophospholipase L1-like esterase